MSETGCKAVLFDLDGTLADTGPDLVAALNVMRVERGLPEVSMKEAGHLVGYGSRLLMREMLVEEGEDIEPLRDRFLREYELTGHSRTTLFVGIEELLRKLEESTIPWAIVTNKPTRQTEGLLPVLGLDGRAVSVVCSDTLERYKPHPDGLLHVCDKVGVEAGKAVFVGDNNLDVKAAQSCGMPFVAAGWGYWEEDMQADLVLSDPLQILELVERR